jgi:hypothetical protein
MGNFLFGRHWLFRGPPGLPNQREAAAFPKILFRGNLVERNDQYVIKWLGGTIYSHGGDINRARDSRFTATALGHWNRFTKSECVPYTYTTSKVLFFPKNTRK